MTYATGARHGGWKGEKAGYQAVHCWLRKHFGKASKCESSNCKGVPEDYKWFEYALKKGFEHSHNRDAYMQMCRSCHRLYDEINKKKI